jgi:hypothetical protein
MPAELPLAAYLRCAFAHHDDGPATTRMLTDQMFVDGWQSKSRYPVNVVGSYLRAWREQGLVRGEGGNWWLDRGMVEEGEEDA